MTCTRFLRVGVIAALTVASVTVTAAMTPQPDQNRPAGAAQPADPTAPTTTSLSREAWEREFGDLPAWRYRRHALRIGQDYTLRAGDTVREVAVVFGSARVAGRVEGDVVVVFGTAHLESTAIIEGSFVVIGGDARVDSGALVRRDVVTVGTAFDMPGDFIFGGEHVVVGTAVLGQWMQSALPWLTGGLLWGRPVVPSLGWVWSVVGIFFVVYLLINLVLHEPVRAAADVVSRRPFGTFLVGLLVLLLWAPITALLAVSVIGIIVIPFFLCALVVAAIVGRVAVIRWIGDSLIASDDPSSRLLALRSFVIGFVLLTLVYMVPVLGFVAWGLVGVFGLGAAVIAFLSAWRKEAPRGGAGRGAQEGAREGAGGASALLAATVPPPAATVPPPAATMPLPATTRASFLERAAAFGLDVLLVGIVHEGLDGWFFPRYSEFFFPLLLIYFIAFWAWKNTTVGGIVMKLRIVKINGAPFEAADAIVRALAGVLSFAAVGIGVLWILRSDDLAHDGLPARQGWHDKAVGTYVVKD